ncbi:MAG: NUDIX domain-containing protein [Neisseriaceae bacterium]
MAKKNHLIEKAVESKQVYDGSFLQVMCDKVILPNDKPTTREYINHPGAACIIAIDSNNEVVLEYQYRYPIDKVMLEFPAGKLEQGESPLNCAKREFQEETGYTAQNWLELGICLPCIAYSTEKIIYYLATGLTKGPHNLDDGELLETLTMPIDNLLQMAYNGEIQDSKTLSGIMLYIGYMHRKFNK